MRKSSWAPENFQTVLVGLRIWLKFVDPWKYPAFWKVGIITPVSKMFRHASCTFNIFKMFESFNLKRSSKRNQKSYLHWLPVWCSCLVLHALASPASSFILPLGQKCPGSGRISSSSLISSTVLTSSRYQGSLLTRELLRVLHNYSKFGSLVWQILTNLAYPSVEHLQPRWYSSPRA